MNLVCRLAVAVLLSVAATGHADESKRWETGQYSFSDELGGFTITSVRGSGLPEDPIVITEELTSSSPVTLVIRALALPEPSRVLHALALQFGALR